MRKTRLKILPARCLAMIGFLLLYLACPILAELSRGEPDHGLASFFQLQELQHCASPPVDPGEGGCVNSWNAHMKMTRTATPDNEHAHTCFTTDVFVLENTCSADQRPQGKTEGHPEPAKRYATTAPRRLLAARSKEPSATTLKVQAPRRQVKYRSLKRSHAPQEELAVGSEGREAISRRSLLAVPNRARIALERTDTNRRSLFMERDVPTRTTEKPPSHKISEVRGIGQTEIQPSITTTAEHRALGKRDISRKVSTEMRTSRITTERTIFQKDGSRRLAFESQQAPKHNAGREFNVRMVASTERRSLMRASTDHKLYQSDTNREMSGQRHSQRSSSSERRIRKSIVPGTTANLEYSRRILVEHRMLENGYSRRKSPERQSSLRVTSDRISETPSRSVTSSRRNFSDARLSPSSSSSIRKDYSTNTPALSERVQISRHSIGQFGSEQRSDSRIARADERISHVERSLARRDSLNEAVHSERRCLTKRSADKNINSEIISGIQRSARSISSQIPTDNRVSRTLPFTRVTFRRSGNVYKKRQSVMSHDRAFHSLPSDHHLSSNSESKQNERQPPESASRIQPGRRIVIMSNEKPASRTIYDRTQTSRIYNEQLPQISSNRLSPPGNMIDRTAVYRTADNRRISTPEFEGIRNMRVSHERRSLSSESVDRRFSFRKTEEHQSPSGRSSPLHAKTTVRISEERRSSRASPTTRRLLTSTVRLSAGMPNRRQDQTVSRRSPEVTTAGRIMLAQRQRTGRTLSLSVSNRHLSADTPDNRNDHVTESAARQSFIRTSVERALVLRDTKRPYAENVIARRDSRAFSTRRTHSEKASRSTEQFMSIRDSRRISAEGLIPVKGSRRFSEGMKRIRDSTRISAERLGISRYSENSANAKSSRRVSEKRQMLDRNTAEHSTSLSSSRRTSVEHLVTRNFGSVEHLQSAREPRGISTERLTHQRSAEQSRQFLTGIDSTRSFERFDFARNYRAMTKSVASIRASRSLSSETLSIRRTFRRMNGDVASTTHNRISPLPMEIQKNSKFSVMRLTHVRGSRSAPTKLLTQGSRKSADRIKNNLDMRTTANRQVSERDSRRMDDRSTYVRNSNIYFNRRTSNMGLGRTVRILALAGSIKITAERDSSHSLEHLTPTRNSRTSAEPMTRNSGRSVNRFSSVRNSRTSDELMTRNSGRRSTDRFSSVRNSRTSAELMTRNSGPSAARFSSVRNSRTSDELTMRNSGLSADRFSSVRNSRTSDELMRNSGRSADRFSSVRNSRTSDELMTRNSGRRSTDRFSSFRNSRTSAKLMTRNSGPSVDHLLSVKNSRTSAELTTRNSGHSVESFSSLRNSRISAQRKHHDKRSVDHLVAFRNFRRGYSETLKPEINSERSVVSTESNMNAKIYTERLVSERESKWLLWHSANLRNTHRLATYGLPSVRNSKAVAEQLKSLRSSGRINHDRHSVSKKATSDHLTSINNVYIRTISSAHRISQSEPLSAIHITSKALVPRNVMRMSNMRNKRLAYGDVSKNKALYQGLELPEKYIGTVDNRTLKTESFFDIGLTLETIQKSVVGFTLAQYPSMYDKVTEYVKSAIATLTLLWPALVIWKGDVPASLISFDGVSAFSPMMEHLDGFFTHKATSNHASVHDDLTLFGSTKASPLVMRGSHGIMTTMIGGGVTAAVMLLSTSSK